MADPNAIPDFSRMNQEELAAFATSLNQQDSAYETNKLDLYKPDSGKQLDFHKSNKKIRLMVTGNRGGKTTAAVIEAIWLALGIHPYHPISVPNRGKIYGESYAAIMESIKMKFDEWCPSQFLHPSKPFTRNQLGQLIGVNFSNGSFLRFGTYDQDVSKAESSNWHYVGFDEPPPRSLYIANMRGCVDFGGLMWFSMTPLKEPWIYDDLWTPGLNGTKKYVECFNWSSDKNPHLDKASLDLFVAELTDTEKETRFEGKFKKLQGLVVDTYDPDISDIEPFPLTDAYAIFEGLDPHPRKPNAALWKAVDADGFRYVVGEIYFDGGIYAFGQEVSRMRQHLCRDGAYIARSIADTSLNQKDLMFKINQRDEFNRALRDSGETVLPAMAQKKDWVLPGLQKLKDLFRPIRNERLDKVLPMEYLFKGRTIRYKWELMHHQWSMNLTDAAKPEDKDNDMISCSRYIESIAPQYETPGTTSIMHANKGAYSRLAGYERYASK